MTKNKNFTLIELLVVISIIAILAGMLLPALGSAKRAQEDEAARNDIKLLEIGAQGYNMDFMVFPLSAPLISWDDAISLDDPSEVEVIMGKFTSHNLNSSNEIINYLPTDTAKGADQMANYIEVSDSRRMGGDPNGAFLDPWGRAWIYSSKDESIIGIAEDEHGNLPDESLPRLDFYFVSAGWDGLTGDGKTYDNVFKPLDYNEYNNDNIGNWKKK